MHERGKGGDLSQKRLKLSAMHAIPTTERTLVRFRPARSVKRERVFLAQGPARHFTLWV